MKLIELLKISIEEENNKPVIYLDREFCSTIVEAKKTIIKELNNLYNTSFKTLYDAYMTINQNAIYANLDENEMEFEVIEKSEFLEFSKKFTISIIDTEKPKSQRLLKIC